MIDWSHTGICPNSPELVGETGLGDPESGQASEAAWPPRCSLQPERPAQCDRTRTVFSPSGPFTNQHANLDPATKRTFTRSNVQPYSRSSL